MPFLKEEKSEHERAPRAGESCPTPLRATLRTPSFKNGQSRAFSRSRRAAGFLLHTFLSPSKEKCERPLGRPVPIRAGVGASIPTKGICLRQSCCLSLQAGGFPLAPCTPSVRLPKQNSTPIRLHLCFRTVVGAPFHRLGGEILTTESLTADKSRGSFLGTNTRQTTACRFLPLEKQTARLALPCRLLLC